MGGGVGLRRAEDPPGPAAGDQASASAERDAGRCDPGDLRAVVGAFRDPVADVRGGRVGGVGPGSAVVPGVLSDPQVPVAGMSELDPRDVRAMVSGIVVGDAAGAYG